jgi:hypothetical protein
MALDRVIGQKLFIIVNSSFSEENWWISTKHTKNSFLIKTKFYFVIENDDYIITFLNSMSVLNTASSDYTERLLLVKFEEIMLYPSYKYEENLNFICIL